ncbi:ABC transporter permease [Candidatus Woesearchaeota archaeon]|nr:ABC transporter permease [Candidatus Woesearchaeota archaeon]
MGVFIESVLHAVRLIATLDPEVLSIAWLSLRISLTAVVLASLIGIPVAVLLAQRRFAGKRLVMGLIHTMMAVPPVVVGLVVYLFLSRDGLLGGLDLLFTPLAMIIAQLLMATPIVIGVSAAAINAIDRSLIDSLVSLGADGGQRVLYLVREARHGLITAVVTGFGAAISEVGAIIIVGGNIRFHTRALTTAIVLETRRGNFELAMALGIILIGLAFMINMALTHVQQSQVRR